MEITPYLNFNGHCEEAIPFYEQLLKGRIVGLLRYGEAPACGQRCRFKRHSGRAFGMTIDRFGTSWIVNTEAVQAEPAASAA